MANRINRLKAKNLGGMPIYRDERKRTVYSAFYMKNGYIIRDEDTFRYLVFSFRFFLMFSCLVFSYAFLGRKIYLSLLITFVFALAVELLFHLWFLPSLQEIRNFHKPEEQMPFRRLMQQSAYRLGLSSATLFLLSIFIFLHLNGFSGDVFNYYTNIAIAAVAGLLSLIFLYCLISKTAEGRAAVDRQSVYSAGSRRKYR